MSEGEAEIRIFETRRKNFLPDFQKKFLISRKYFQRCFILFHFILSYSHFPTFAPTLSGIDASDFENAILRHLHEGGGCIAQWKHSGMRFFLFTA